jgi:hypothetical protein
MRLAQQRVYEDVRGDAPSGVSSDPGDPLAELTAAGLVALGAALVIWAYRKAPTEHINSYDPIFWAGMVLAYLAVAWRALFGRYTILWLGALGLFTLLPKFYMSPNGPIYFDETAHFALLRNIISAGKLFQHTPLLPIGTDYPGMESMAAAIHWLTGMSPWDSALTVVAVAHGLLLVEVYYLARALPVPHRWAAAAGLVYAANPSFIYEDVQFAYESVAIVLMLTIVRLYVEGLAAERAGGRTWRQSLSTSLLIAVLCFGCVLTHHLTSLTGFALLLAGALFIKAKPRTGLADHEDGGRRLFVRWAPVLTLGTFLALWIGFVAPGTLPYLFPHVSRPVSLLLALAGVGHGTKGAGGVRSLFSASVAPGYEREAAVAAPVLISLALLFGGIRWLWKRRLRWNFLWPFVVTAIYLVSLPLTLVQQGNAGAHRTWATTYLGVTLLPAALVVLFQLEKRSPWVKRTAMAAGAVALVILLIGNVTAGESVEYRFPGPYKFASDTYSVTPETLRLADWVRTHLGPNAHIVTDRFTALPLTTYGEAVTPLPLPNLPIQAIYYDRRPPPPSLMTILRHQGDKYLAVDIRDAQYVDPSTQPALFVQGEPAIVPRQNITRLAQWPWLRLLYSSEHYRLYRINFASYFRWYPSHASGKVHVKTHKQKPRHKKARHKKARRPVAS